MAKSKIILNVNSFPPKGSQVAIYDGNTDVLMSESFEPIRTTGGIAELSSTLEGVAIHLAVALNMDYNTNGKYSITTSQGNRQVIIQALTDDSNLTLMSNSTNGAISIGSDMVLETSVVPQTPVQVSQPVQTTVPKKDVTKQETAPNETTATNTMPQPEKLTIETLITANSNNPTSNKKKIYIGLGLLLLAIATTYLLTKKSKK